MENTALSLTIFIFILQYLRLEVGHISVATIVETKIHCAIVLC